MQAGGILGRGRTHPRIRMQNGNAGEDKLWGEAIPKMAAQPLSCLWPGISHSARMANGRRPGAPLPQSP